MAENEGGQQGAEQQTGGNGAADQGADPNGQQQNNDEQLGEGGLRALQAERDGRKVEADARKVAEDEVKRLTRALAAAERGKLSAEEQAIAAAKDEGRREAAAEFGEKLARTSLESAIAKRNKDYKIADLLEFVPIERFVGENGDPDLKVIEQAVTRFVPELGDGGGAGNGTTSFDGGQRRNGPRPTSMNDLIRGGARLRTTEK